MQKIIEKFQEYGFGGMCALLFERLIRMTYIWILYIGWRIFRICESRRSNISAKSVIDDTAAKTQNNEKVIEEILVSIRGGSFLEIGIGSHPRISRIRSILANNIKYTGCDFDAVCRRHESIIKAVPGYRQEQIRFLKNNRGTYSWNLFSALQRGELFDAIYLDGHHTFYVDLPALILADKLLKPGGYLIIDDIRWTLQFMKDQLIRSFDDWILYRGVYDFSEYEDAEQAMPHIGMIVDEILLKPGVYTKLSERSTPDWYVLKKPV